jgi:hypothetical protein
MAAMTVSLVAVAEVDMAWKCSRPEALLRLGAAVAARVPDRAIAPAASMEPAAVSRRRWFCAWWCSPWELMTPRSPCRGHGDAV